MLAKEIEDAQRRVTTDAYQMSLGEIVNMYENQEIVIDPAFQRYFRWDISQKSKFIESILLGIPIPPIFVFEKEDGRWELVDGLQRISTILEFMGKLLDTDGNLKLPSALEATKYLPSLHNAVWDRSEKINEISVEEQQALDKGQQLAIRRARMGIQILKRPSNENTKYDLFQRLNSGGTLANRQEVRNCIMLMVNKEFYNSIDKAAGDKTFQRLMVINDEQIERQKHMEYATRFSVYSFVDYDGRQDVEDYIDNGIVKLAESGHGETAANLLEETFRLLDSAIGEVALKSPHSGRIGYVALEVIAIGVAKNLSAIKAAGDELNFIKTKAFEFWNQSEIPSFTAQGLRGTTRIQRTLPFGKTWFAP